MLRVGSQGSHLLQKNVCSKSAKNLQGNSQEKSAPNPSDFGVDLDYAKHKNYSCIVCCGSVADPLLNPRQYIVADFI